MAPASDDRGNERTGGGGGGDEEEGSSGGGWITTYADMVTLLLTFFVLMLALSSTDTAKMEMFMLALSRDGITAEQFMEIQEKYDLTDRDIDDWDEEFPNPDNSSADYEDLGGQAALKDLYDSMNEYIENEGLSDHMEVSLYGDFLTITLANDVLFESGSAVITPEAVESAAAISGMIDATFVVDDPFEIVIAGHTDSDPISTSRYPSNWHVGMDRAMNFLWELLSNSQLRYDNPGAFSARSYGEYRPRATNDTPEGKAKNRRVEVLVSLARYNPLWEADNPQPDAQSIPNGFNANVD